MIQVRSSGNTKVGVAAAALLWLVSVTASAQDVAMTSGFSGSWFDPDHSGQGFVVQVLERSDGPVALVYFFTYTSSGAPLWLFGLNQIDGNAVDVVLREPVLDDISDVTGEISPPELVEWGTLRLSFDDCGAGTAEVLRREKIQVRSGTLRLSRLAGIAAKSCTGGRSDDVLPEAPAQGFERFLSSNGIFGVATYEQRPGEASLAVALKKAPDGDYIVAIDGKPIGGIEVEDGLGELMLHSPAEVGEQLLTVNPIGGQLSLLDSKSTELLTVNLPQARELSTGGAPPPFGNERIQALTRVDAEEVPTTGDRQSSGVIAQADLMRRQEAVTFAVELTGAEPTTYDVLVDGQVRSRIGVVSAGPEQSYGRVLFRFPLAPGAEPLTFDPRGSRVEIRPTGTFVSGINAATTVAFDFPNVGEIEAVNPKGSNGKAAFSR